MRPTLGWLLLPWAASADPVVVPLTRRHGLGRGDQRRLSLVDEARLYGNLHRLMSYHVDVLVGTPGQMQSVIVDTGSAMTAFPCTFCGSSCGRHIDPPFDPANSSTFRWIACNEPQCAACDSRRTSCTYSVNYVEGSSIEGRYFEDVLHLGHIERRNSQAPVWLGCHTRETNLFLRQEPSGIMGLDRDNWDVLTALMGGALEEQVIGMCLSDEGGAMSFGGLNASWTPITAPMQFVRYGPKYSVSVAGASLVSAGGGSYDLAALAGTYAMDTGTTFSYMTSSQALALRTAIQNTCGAPGACGGARPAAGNCWLASDADVDLFPRLHISFVSSGREQVTYIWEPRGYMSSQHLGHWCYTFFAGPPLTFGASFMRHHLLVFNRDQRTIGFAPSPCPSITSRSDAVQLHAAGAWNVTLPGPAPPRSPAPGPGGSNSTSGAASGSPSLMAGLLALCWAFCTLLA